MFWNHAQGRKVGILGLGETQLADFRSEEPMRRTASGIPPTTRMEKVEPLVARFLAIRPEEMHRHFQPATSRHLDQIVGIRREMFNLDPAEDRIYLQWRYDFSPAEESTTLEENRIWVFIREDEILGFVGVEAADLVVNGRIIHAIKVMDLAVKPEVDRKGLGVWMNLHLQRTGRPIVALGSNRNSLGIMSKLFHRMPNQKVYKNLLNSSHYFERKAGPFIAPFLSLAYDTLFQLLLAGKSQQLKADCEVREVTRFTHMENRALGRMEQSGIRFKRDADYLNWRLLQNPLDNVKVIGLWASGQLVAYLAAAFRPVKNSDFNLGQVVILDWGSLPEELYRRSLVALLVARQQLWKKNGFESVIAFGYDSASDELLKSAGLHRREDETKTFSIFAPDQAMLRLLVRPEQWFINGSDTDYA